MQPESFGPYILARKIATGGTAEIFLARREGAEGFARHVAIKRILPKLARDTEFVKLILDEARLAAHLHHGHIVQIHDVGTIEGQAYIAMEYLPGTDVGRLMRRARKRVRRVIVAHADLELRARIIDAIKGLSRKLEIVQAHDADEVARRSADGPVDLAVVDGRLASIVVDRLSSAHPELLRTIVLGNPKGLAEAPTTLVTTDDEPDIVAELVDCCLRAPMPIDVAVQIIRAVADGLEHAHNAVDYAENPLHIVHRDVNPANVLVSKNGTVKLVDFGIARAATTPEGRRKGFVGTYDYMSPEQTEGDVVDPRSDLFSLGTLIHLLVTGEHPYKGGDPFATMRAIREDAPPPLDARVPGTPSLLVDIALRAAEKAPDDRYPSAEAMLADLEEVVRRAGINLSPKRLASYMQALFGEEVKSFGVTTMSMPAVRIDADGNPVAVRARASVDTVGRPKQARIVARPSQSGLTPPAHVSRVPPSQVGAAPAAQSGMVAPSQSGLVPLLHVPANPPPTMDAVPALTAAGPDASRTQAMARPTPAASDGLKTQAIVRTPELEAAATQALADPALAPFAVEQQTPAAARAPALDAAATQALADPALAPFEVSAGQTMGMARPGPAGAPGGMAAAMSVAALDAAPTMAMQRPPQPPVGEAAATQAFGAAAAEASASESAATQAFGEAAAAAAMDGAVTQAMERPQNPATFSPPPHPPTMESVPALLGDEEDSDGPTQVAPPSPEVLAAIAAASIVRPSPQAPPRRAPEPVAMQAPAEHIARRLGSGRSDSGRYDAASPIGHRPSGQVPMTRTPVGARGSVRSLHSINAAGPPPSRSRSSESAMRVTLGVVVVALVGLVGLYVWWRMSGG